MSSENIYTKELAVRTINQSVDAVDSLLIKDATTGLRQYMKLTLDTTNHFKLTDHTTYKTLSLADDIRIVDGGTIGQAAGPLLTFDDTNNYLEITGCNVGIGTTSPYRQLTILGSTYTYFRMDAPAGYSAIIEQFGYDSSAVKHQWDIGVGIPIGMTSGLCMIELLGLLG